MKAQKLKTFSDFLKRTVIIPHALLIITEDDSVDCTQALLEIRSLNYDIPFYELNLSENPNLIKELSQFYSIDGIPTFIYFRGKKMISKVVGFDKTNNFTHFLSDAIQANA